MIDVIPERVLTNFKGEEVGLGNMQNIEIVGDDIDGLICKDFVVQRGINLAGNVAWKYRFLKNGAVIKDFSGINKLKCIKCGECINQCPVNPIGINWNKSSKFPVYDYNNCIRCYCCQEVCPERAIDIKTPITRKIMDIIFS